MKSRGSAARIAVAAMLVALSLIVSALPSLPGPITKFGGFPLLLCGLLVGPRLGFAAGCLTDLIGYAAHPTGPFFPGFVLTQGLTGAIPGFFSWGRDPYSWKKSSAPQSEPLGRGGALASYLRLLLVFGITQGVTSVYLVSLFRSKFVAGTPMAYELTTRAIAQATHVPVYAFLAFSILRVLSTTDLYRRLLARPT